MAKLEHIGREEVSGRELYVIDAERPEDIPEPVAVASDHFVCFLAWDAAGVSIERIAELARRLLAAGCAYVCCWGTDCERVHDIVDEVDLERAPDGPWAMTTWHAHDGLADALWFALFNTYPDDAFMGTCGSVIAISIGAPERAVEMRNAMADPGGFSGRVVDADPT
jgi:hypothetical protein